MDSEECVMPMQQGEEAWVCYSTKMTNWREGFFPLLSLVCYQTPYDTRSQLTMGRVISPHPDNVEIGYFCYSNKIKIKRSRND